jgi:hypothetical protein
VSLTSIGCDAVPLALCRFVEVIAAVAAARFAGVFVILGGAMLGSIKQ